MNEYNMMVDEKVSMWRREFVTVEAETLEEAVQKCLNGDYVVNSTEDLYETSEKLDPCEIKGPTFEIYDEDGDGDLIYTNDPIAR